MQETQLTVSKLDSGLELVLEPARREKGMRQEVVWTLQPLEQEVVCTETPGT